MKIILSTYCLLFCINCYFKKILYVTARIRATSRAFFKKMNLIFWNRRRQNCKLYNMLLDLAKMCSSVLGLKENPFPPVDTEQFYQLWGTF